MEPTDYIPILQDHVGAQKVMERRLTSRLLAYWERVRGDRLMPTENDLNPDGDISDMWDDCFLIHVSDIEMDGYNFIFLGDNIRVSLVGEDTEPTRIWDALNVKRLAPSIQQVLEKKAPLLDEGETYNDANQLVKYRQCLLPIGEGDKVLAIFGGMRCKIHP